MALEPSVIALELPVMAPKSAVASSEASVMSMELPVNDPKRFVAALELPVMARGRPGMVPRGTAMARERRVEPAHGSVEARRASVMARGCGTNPRLWRAFEWHVRATGY